MASITRSYTSTSFAVLQAPAAAAGRSPFLRLPAKGRTGKVRCAMEGKQAPATVKVKVGILSSLVAAAAGVASPAAVALVDERMSTEGTGLPFGLSNNLLGWILFGVFGLIWTLYFVYTSTLDEDDDSGLSL